MSGEVEREFGRRLRWLRRARGLTQEDLAAPCGVSFQQIQKYETGASTVSAARLWRLATVLGVDVQFFFEGVGQRRQPGRTTARRDRSEHVSGPS